MKQLLGDPVKQDVENKIVEAVKEFMARGIEPKLAVIRAGEDPGQVFYEGAIVKAAENYGIELQSIKFGEDVAQAYLANAIQTFNADEAVHGIILLRPFPKHIDEEALRQLLSPSKDVDAITDISIADTFVGKTDAFYACTAEACVEILHYYGIDPCGKKITIVGRSLTVGKPLAVMLLNENATVTVCHSRTAKEDQIQACQMADVVVLATGRTESFGREFFREGQIVIDVGTGTGSDGKIHGDLNIADIEESGMEDFTYTPVPGGVGRVTTALLLRNIIKSASKNS